MAESIFPTILCRFPVPEEEKHPHIMIEPPPCLTVGIVFFFAKASLFLRQTYRWSMGPKSTILVSSVHKTDFQNFSGLLRWFLACPTRLRFCLGVSSGVFLWALACSPCSCSVRLTVATETSVPATARSSWSSLAVTLGFLSACRRTYLAVAGDIFFGRLRPGRFFSTPVALNLKKLCSQLCLAAQPMSWQSFCILDLVYAMQ